MSLETAQDHYDRRLPDTVDDSATFSMIRRIYTTAFNAVKRCGVICPITTGHVENAAVLLHEPEIHNGHYRQPIVLDLPLNGMEAFDLADVLEAAAANLRKQSVRI